MIDLITVCLWVAAGGLERPRVEEDGELRLRRRGGGCSSLILLPLSLNTY